MSQVTTPLGDGFAPGQSSAQSRPKRCWRLSAFSILVLALMLAAFVVLVVPGTGRPASEDDKYRLAIADPKFQPFITPPTGMASIDVATWSHGWPFEYCARLDQQAPKAPAGALNETFSWLNADAWRVTSSVYRFHSWRLVADVAIAVTILVVVVGGCERWRRRRGRLRFSLFDIAAVATLVCCLLGWRQWHLHEQQVESDVVNALIVAKMATTDSSVQWTTATGATARQKQTVGNIVPTTTYCGPDWLVRLTGNSAWTPPCWHVTKLDLETTELDAADFEGVSQLRYLNEVDCRGQLTPALVEALAKLPNLRKLMGTDPQSFVYDEPPLVTSKDVQLLARLRNLEFLDLTTSDLQPADLRIVDELPRLTTMQLSGHLFLIEDMERLAAHPSLKIVYAMISATAQEQRDFEQRHPGLRVFWVKLTRRASVPDVMLSDPWYIGRLRIARWRDEAGAGNRVLGRSGILNLSGATLTRERLLQLPPQIFADVNEVTLGGFDSPETAAEFVMQCQQVEYVRSCEAPLEDPQIRQFCQLPMLRSLRVIQGSVQAETFCELGQLPTFKWLEIYSSTYTGAEVQIIRDAVEATAADRFVEVYSGPADAPENPIRPDAR